MGQSTSKEDQHDSTESQMPLARNDSATTTKDDLEMSEGTPNSNLRASLPSPMIDNRAASEELTQNDLVTPISSFKASSPPSQSSPISNDDALEALTRPEPMTPTPHITRPGLPRQVTHLSSLVDPTELAEGWQVRSPSGNLLGAEAFLQHPERPLSLRERQEKVRQAMRARTASDLAAAAHAQEIRKTTGHGGVRPKAKDSSVDGKDNSRTKKRRCCC